MSYGRYNTVLIADLIRQKLSMCPEGAFTSEITLYCLQNGAKFSTFSVSKSVSGQLSKMRAAGYVTFEAFGKDYRWKLARYNNYTSEPQSEGNIDNSIAESYNAKDNNEAKVDDQMEYGDNIVNENKVKEELEILGRSHNAGGYFDVTCTVINNSSIPHKVLIKAIFFDENKVPISVVESISKVIEPGDIERFDFYESKSYVVKKIKSYDLIIKKLK